MRTYWYRACLTLGLISMGIYFGLEPIWNKPWIVIVYAVAIAVWYSKFGQPKKLNSAWASQNADMRSREGRPSGAWMFGWAALSLFWPVIVVLIMLLVLCNRGRNAAQDRVARAGNPPLRQPESLGWTLRIWRLRMLRSTVVWIVPVSIAVLWMIWVLQSDPSACDDGTVTTPLRWFILLVSFWAVFAYWLHISKPLGRELNHHVDKMRGYLQDPTRKPYKPHALQADVRQERRMMLNLIGQIAGEIIVILGLYILTISWSDLNITEFGISQILSISAAGLAISGLGVGLMLATAHYVREIERRNIKFLHQLFGP